MTNDMDKFDKSYDEGFKDGIEQGKKDEREKLLKYLKHNLVDKVNPCMKCGSILCAICYEDIKKELMKDE